MNHKLFFGRILFGSFLVVLVYFVVNVFYYTDPINLCMIRIKGDVLHNNSQSIRKILGKIKNEEYDSYNKLCKNINSIIESNCYEGDGHYSSDWIADKPGCFVKGTKIIYLTPTNSVDLNSIENERYETLIHLSSAAEKYWAK